MLLCLTGIAKYEVAGNSQKTIRLFEYLVVDELAKKIEAIFKKCFNSTIDDYDQDLFYKFLQDIYPENNLESDLSKYSKGIIDFCFYNIVKLKTRSFLKKILDDKNFSNNIFANFLTGEGSSIFTCEEMSELIRDTKNKKDSEEYKNFDDFINFLNINFNFINSDDRSKPYIIGIINDNDTDLQKLKVFLVETIFPTT